MGSIPPGVRYLDLGFRFNQPLTPGVLPNTLRELLVSTCYNQALQAGSLPDRLKVLAFELHEDNFKFPPSAFQQQLLPGLIPPSVVAIRMSRGYKQELVAGSIPATVRWLRLPWYYRDEKQCDVLSLTTEVTFWRRPREELVDENQSPAWRQRRARLFSAEHAKFLRHSGIVLALVLSLTCI